MESALVSNADLDAATMDELAELADCVREVQKGKRAEAKERVAALKEEMSGLRQRRTKRSKIAEPEAAERPAKKKKKRNRD